MKLFKIFIFGLGVIFIFNFYLAAAQAQNLEPPDLKIQIGKTVLDFEPVAPCKGGDSSSYCIGWISQYIGVVYRYGVGLAAVLAAIMIMVGGFLWLASAGNPSQIGKGKEFIMSALTGLILALFSFLILQTINPRLVALEDLKVGKISDIETAMKKDLKMCCQRRVALSPNEIGVGSKMECTEVQGVAESAGGEGTDVATQCNNLRGTLSPGGCWNIKGCPQYNTTDNAQLLRDSMENGVTYADNVNVIGAANEALQTLSNVYGRFNPQVNDWIRDDGTRHDPDIYGEGKVADIHYDPNSELTRYITTRGREDTEPTWGTAYHMPDGSVWVLEPGGSTGYHWHVEFNAENSYWVANR